MIAAPEPAPLVERGCAPVYFVNRIAKITPVGGGNLMFAFYREDDGRREIEVKIVCSREDAKAMLRQTECSLSGCPVAQDGNDTPARLM
jgi:hypothetical protein